MQKLRQRVIDLETLLDEYKVTNAALGEDVDRLEVELKARDARDQGDVSMAEDEARDVPSPEKWQEALKVIGQVQERNRELEEGEHNVEHYCRNSCSFLL